MNRIRVQWAVLIVVGVLFGGVVGCSYHNDRDRDHGYRGGEHDREDVYVHDHDHDHGPHDWH